MTDLSPTAPGAGRLLVLTPTPPAFVALESLAGVGDLAVETEPGRGLDAAGVGGWGAVLVDTAFAGGAGREVALELAGKGATIFLVARTASLELTLGALSGGVRDVLAFPPDPETFSWRLGPREDAGGGVVPLMEVAPDDLVGSSPPMLALFRLVARAAASTADVLILGEPGTGKATLARALHRHGPRAAREFVTLSCASIPEPLLESELFGHEAGTFPWAVAQRRGRLERASGGLLYLDQVEALSSRLQVRLLQVLEEGRVERVGATRSQAVDVRLLAGATQDLLKLVEEGRFRADLYNRLALMTLWVPPLRERGDDLTLLARAFAASAARRHGRDLSGISSEALRALARHGWPGNLRELKMAVERAVIVSEGPVLTPRQLPPPPRWITSPDGGDGLPVAPDASLDVVEEAHIRRVLRGSDGNLTRAAEVLGIHRNTLRRKLKSYGIES